MKKKKLLKIQKINQNIEAYLSRFVVKQGRAPRTVRQALLQTRKDAIMRQAKNFRKKTKFNLRNKLRKNLFFSRLFNKNIDLAKVKSANQILGTKSLKLRILSIRKVNKKLNKQLKHGYARPASKLRGFYGLPTTTASPGVQANARYRLNLLNVSKSNAAEASLSRLRTADKNVTKRVVNNKLLKNGGGLPAHVVASSARSSENQAKAKFNLFALGTRPQRFLSKYKTKNKKYQYNLKISNYLKTITSFEPDIAQFQNIVYNFNNNTAKKFKINSILENTFNSLNSLIGTPVYEITPNNITINLFYYFSKKAYLINIIKILLKKQSVKQILQNQFLTRKILKNQYGMKMKFRIAQKRGKLMYHIEQKFKYFKSLILFLSKKFNKPIKFDLIRLKHPTLDSKISANAIGLIVNKLNRRFLGTAFNFFRIANIKNPTFIKNIIAAHKNSNKIALLSGINLKKAGRFVTQPLIPKLTTKIIQQGSINRTNTDFVTKSRFTAKNKRGAFSITITMGHKFF